MTSLVKINREKSQPKPKHCDIVKKTHHQSELNKSEILAG